MNSFIENVNYVASLDNKYGSSIEIYKNNLSLRTEQHDIVFTLDYYNFAYKKIQTLEYSYNDISIDNFNSTLLNFKSQVELTGLFDCAVSFSYTNFIINNVASIDIKITSKSENIKTYELNLNITKDLIELYNINGVVSDTLKILPYLATIDSDLFDTMIDVSNNIEDIQNAEENANIAIAQANIATVKASEALSSANSASASEIVSIEKSNIAISKASESSTSASEALASENAAKISETNASVSEVNALASANNADISEANALASASSASSSATIATTKAGEAMVSAANALSSENSALDSKNSAIASASTSVTKANEALSSAGVASTQAGITITKASEASTSASNALDSENKAEKWATELEDVAVVPGQYSAMHWAIKAQAFSEGDAVNIGYDGTISGLISTNVQDSIDELDGNIDMLTANVYSKQEVRESLPVVGLSVSAGTTVGIGQIAWNSDEGTADLGLNGGSVLQIGQENIRTVRNGTAGTIANGTLCMFDGTIGNSGRIKVKPFTAGFNEAMYLYGVSTQSISSGSDGIITIEGKVRGVNTTGAAVGEVWHDEDILYAKPNDNGRMTNIMPADNELKLVVATVIHAHTSGTLEIRFTPFNENMYYTKVQNDILLSNKVPLNSDFILDLGEI